MNQRTRFEIFKRDGFMCGYCGSRPPNVILEVDHILALSNGGTDDPENLITSCFDCNRGKSNLPLENKRVPLRFSAEVEKERLLQVQAYQSFLEEKTALFEQWFQRVSAAWITLDGEDATRLVISGEREQAVRRFLRRLPPEEIIDALHVAYERISPNRSDYSRFKFFCGTCWRKIKRAEGEQI